ncbi:hypothetical protein MUS1_11495 [Marinomonas ushuaiensis DSM 15871]|uniref:Uncharacterized protein n=2 Tax=Marinomonas TaxID=28253 RepID=X7E5C1_9GAMM|nr:hypothetical protein MUS1_11495 [Marinomonas ushuaiensis DSM 15871]
MEYLVFDLKLIDIVKSSSILYPYKASIKLNMLKVSCDPKQICSKPVLFDLEKYLVEIGVGENRSRILKITSFFVIDEKQESLIITDYPKHIKSVLDVFEK